MDLVGESHTEMYFHSFTWIGGGGGGENSFKRKSHGTPSRRPERCMDEKEGFCD